MGTPRIPQMAPLPKDRIEIPMAAFQNVALDFTGAYETIQGRGRARIKRYGCFFSCMSCRAVHFELAADLSTSGFLDCLARFAARRGMPQNIYCDNGRNFTGAVRELRELVAQMDQDQINEFSLRNNVKFYFNPPYASHFGGVFESIIKSGKRAIRAILKDADMTDLELVTVFSLAEDILNSRPLALQNDDQNDFSPLTPAMFLTGRMSGMIFPPNIDSNEFDTRKRWLYVQRAAANIWKRWQKEILPTLGPRGKWFRDNRDYQQGDQVLVVEKDLPRYKWRTARVTEVHPGRDGRVRVVDLNTADGPMQAPVHRLIPLT